MAVPKRKVSKSRSKMRRAHQALSTPQFYECPNCSQQNKPHTVCVYCGYYLNRKSHGDNALYTGSLIPTETDEG